MPSVTSSVIQAVDYDAESRTLFVTFHEGGRVYAYFGVPAEVFGAFMDAESKGRYFIAHVRGFFADHRVR